MGEKECVYCHNTNSNKMSNEHVISESVLKVAFGEDIKNIVRSTLFKKVLLDHEQTVKDVCMICNSKLSDYDNNGKNLVSFINKYYDATNLFLPFNYQVFNWLIKTHLNFLRIIPDKASGQIYPINSKIYSSIINDQIVPSHLCKLFFEGWQGLDYFWNENDERRIQYFAYKSVRFLSHGIVVSNLRIKIKKEPGLPSMVILGKRHRTD